MKVWFGRIYLHLYRCMYSWGECFANPRIVIADSAKGWTKLLAVSLFGLDALFSIKKKAVIA